MKRIEKDPSPTLSGVVITVLLAAVVVFSLRPFFQWVEGRQGTRPFEPLLQHLPAADLSNVLFATLYVSILLALVLVARTPFLLFRGLQAYLLLLVLRMCAMALVPLEPPPGLIDLRDPIAQLVYPAGVPFRMDLFFSGHTATAYLLFLVVPGPSWKVYFGLLAFLVGSAVLVQHVHWSLDVVCAPPAAWCAWRLSAVTSRYSAMFPGKENSGA